MKEIENINLFSVLTEVEKLEDSKNKFSNTFTDMLKNEIDATDEPEVYNNIRKLVYKYKDDEKALQIIDEVVEALSEGATLSEILLIAKDEIEYPTPINVMNLDEFNAPKH
ncbi:MAG: hypothetical protein PWP27_1476 [Clostridiales bacterium]|jgi:hypothetical protein|nr:hypothetical protein [Clostridiales bacterium]MDK2933666.1 hypothetical protein [Clostridiales bacterium]